MLLISLQSMSHVFSLATAAGFAPEEAHLRRRLIPGIGNVKNLTPEPINTMDPPLLAKARELLVDPGIRRQRIPIRDVAILVRVLSGMHSIEMLEHPRSPLILSSCPIASVESVP